MSQQPASAANWGMVIGTGGKLGRFASSEINHKYIAEVFTFCHTTNFYKLSDGGKVDFLLVFTC